MNPQLNFMLQQAVQSFQNNNLERADSILQKVLQADSKNFVALHILGLIKSSQGKYQEGADLLARASRLNPNEASIQYNLAKVLMDCGNHKKSLPHHKRAVDLAPKNPDAWLNYGKTLSHLEFNQEALHAFEKTLAIQPNYAEAWSNYGLALNQLERFEEALESFEKAIRLRPDHAEAWSNKGIALKNLKRYDDAIAQLDHALSLNPQNAEAWSNKGAVLSAMKVPEEAIPHFDKALQLNPNNAEIWSNKGAVLNTMQRHEEAISHFDKALQITPDYAEAWSNKGAVLSAVKRYEEAIAHFDQSLSLRPGHSETWRNKGAVLSNMRYYEEAIEHFDQSIKLKLDNADAWGSKGLALNLLKRYEEAISSLNEALRLKPDIDWGYGSLLQLNKKICSWSNLAEDIEKLEGKLHANEKVVHPFIMHSSIDDSSLHKKAAEIFANSEYPENPALGPILKRPRNKKIRIGYFSADFRNHAVSFLTAELFELHDKSKFEIIAFSAGPDDQSTMRLRLEKAFDQFIDINNHSDQDVAKLARELGIDIAVDLGGFTAENRLGIFTYRAAPIQVSYIGFLGTTGTPYMDYLLSDRTITPEGTEQFYSEKIACLPSYQVNDSQRRISEKVFTRSELGLPENGFIFTCFNNNYKILPSIFASWMRILKACEGSILFLYAENESVKHNLIKEAEALGVDGQRLKFGKHLPADEYLSRYRACNVFLDTTPYNAGTTASDALWTGLPVLTLIGKSFASRVAASILNAIGLPELITDSQAEYEALAIELAHNPQKLATIKRKLSQNRQGTRLFDTATFTKNIEVAYTKMYERYQADLAPDHIFIQ